MSNRFQNIGFQPRNIEFFPEVQQDILPDISGLGNYMQSLDAQLDQDLELPKYIEQSESDKNAYLGFKQESQKFRDNAIEAFKSGKNDVGNEYLRQYKNFLKKAKQPDGTYSRLEQGKAQYDAQLKRLQDTYLKGENANPLLFNYAKRKLDSGINPFEDEFGNARTDIGYPNLVSDKPRREAVKTLNEVLKNITADQVVSRSYLGSVKGLSFQDLLTQDKIKYIDRQKVQSILLDAVRGNPEMIQAFEQYGEALTGKKGQGTVSFTKEGTFDTSTALGATLKSLVDSKVFQQKDKDTKVVNRFADQERFKSNLRKREKDYEYSLGQETMNSHVYTKATGMPDLDVSMAGEIKEISPETYLNPLTGTAATRYKTDLLKDKSFEELLETEEGRKKYPALIPIVERFPQGTMSTKEYNKMIKEKYDLKKNKMAQEDVVITKYGDSKIGEARRNSLLGKGSQPLNEIMYKNIVVKQPGKEPKVYNATTFMNEYRISPEKLKENLAIVGKIETNNVISPSGEEAIWVDPENPESTISMVITDISREDLEAKRGIYKLLEPLRNGSLQESGWAQIGIPELDTAYGKMLLEPVDIYELDILEKQLTSPMTTEDEREKISERIDLLENNPNLNTYSHTEGRIMIEDPEALHIDDPQLRRKPLTKPVTITGKNGKTYQKEEPVTPEDLIELIEKSLNLK